VARHSSQSGRALGEQASMLGGQRSEGGERFLLFPSLGLKFFEVEYVKWTQRNDRAKKRVHCSIC